MNGAPSRDTLVMVALLGWCAMMVLYWTVYNVLESRAVPVTLPTRDFETYYWDFGTFYASGSLLNESAKNAGEDLVPGTTRISCVRETSSCDISTATVFDHFLYLDTSHFDGVTWNARQITFVDDTPMCVTVSYVIDRASKTMTLTARSRIPIPAYALKSPLHPCAGPKEMKSSLVDGPEVYDRQIAYFERENSLKFRIALIILNLAYFALLFRAWGARGRKLRQLNPA